LAFVYDIGVNLLASAAWTIGAYVLRKPAGRLVDLIMHIVEGLKRLKKNHISVTIW